MPRRPAAGGSTRRFPLAHLLARCPAPACLALLALLTASCGDGVEEPIRDGYRLIGTVADAMTGEPLAEVEVLIGRDDSPDRHLQAVTGSDGRFEYLGFPATAPSSELFRFEKQGYVAREVAAHTAAATAPSEYRLAVELDALPGR
ncbi:MAG: hypothetical protein PVF43_02960 [Candidatus Eiseniibacteriota bacterium]|jgi:hypothetical protein